VLRTSFIYLGLKSGMGFWRRFSASLSCEGLRLVFYNMGLLGSLDEVELGFEAGDERFFLSDLILSFFDEMLGGFFHVIRVGHTSI